MIEARSAELIVFFADFIKLHVHPINLSSSPYIFRVLIIIVLLSKLYYIQRYFYYETIPTHTHSPNVVKSFLHNRLLLITNVFKTEYLR